MKSIASLLLPILLLSACQITVDNPNPNSLSAEETQAAKDLIQGAFDDLWGGVDSTKILDYHTEDFIILEQGEIWDNNRIKEYMRSQLERPDRPKRLNMMDYISIEKYGNSIQIAYFNDAEFTQQDSVVGNARWLESALAIETEEGWRLKMMHSTRVRK